MKCTGPASLARPSRRTEGVVVASRHTDADPPEREAVRLPGDDTFPKQWRLFPTMLPVLARAILLPGTLFGSCMMNMIKSRPIAATRRRHVYLLPILALAAGLQANAQTSPPPEEVAAQWFKIRNGFAAQYEARQTEDAAFSGHYGISVRSTGTPTNGAFGGILQASQVADDLRGQRVAMRAWIRTESAESVSLWLRIDAVDRVLALDNMEHRSVSGTTGWLLYEIVMDVPTDAATLVYGVFLVGMGRMDVDDVHFLPVPVGAISTTVYKENQLKPKQGQTYTPPSIVQDAPANLDFERVPGS
jgi:hypothetical protein